MSIFAKVAVALALALPMAAYVAGTLVAGEPEPVRHDPIVMESPSDPATPDGDPTLGQGDGTRDPSRRPEDAAPEVVTVDPDDLDDSGEAPPESRTDDDDDDDGDGPGDDDDHDEDDDGPGDDGDDEGDDDD